MTEWRDRQRHTIPIINYCGGGLYNVKWPFTKISKDCEFLILTGILFQTVTTENERLPLNKLHLACGHVQFFLDTYSNFDAVL